MAAKSIGESSGMTPRASVLDLSTARWFKSTHSDPQGDGDCVQVATNFSVTHDLILIGDTKTPGVHIAVSPEAFTAFVTATATGEFGTI
ncbi:DUF397 domain-containing protein [Streptomyces kaniharaensis]|uniref:DUF397 domain-containing protein n=1 Tax=Streptomyces kaniharaensis TaxID=212423 RepID=A0A6N7KI63_9ACTN|nr:DUF397 domain-containing protein [Streptomyces kaniharaensis]MQS11021.1 DUF397 domain-containing protein [Streptomyces kaniharaensis]